MDGKSEGIDWVQAWPRVRRDLQRHLANRVGSVALAEDLCQDVAEVLLASPGRSFEREDNLFRWARRVVENRHLDIVRHERRQDLGADPVDRCDHRVDVEAHVEHRMLLGAALQAMQALRPADANALLVATPPAVDAAQRNRDNVRRHRARRRLVAALEAAGALGIAVVGRGRRLARRFMPMAAVALPVVAVVTLTTIPSPESRDPSGAVHDVGPIVGADLELSAIDGPTSDLEAHRAEQARDTANSIARVQALGGRGVGIDHEPEEDPHTACFRNFPGLPDTCIDRPALPVALDPPGGTAASA